MLGIVTEPASGATSFAQVTDGHGPLRVRDRMLVAWRPSPGKGETGGDGCVTLGYSGEGLEWWMGDVSPNMGHWRYRGVPDLEGQPAGLYLWEGWVESADDHDIWAGRWRRANSLDLAGFDILLAPIAETQVIGSGA